VPKTIKISFFAGVLFIAVLLLAAEDIQAYCPWSIAGGTIQPAGILAETGDYDGPGGSYPTSWDNVNEIERGAPFEAGFTSSVPNQLAFYPGNCQHYSIGCGSKGWLNLHRADGWFVTSTWVQGQMVVFNTSVSRWSGSNCSGGYGTNCSYGYRDEFGTIPAGSSYWWFVQDPNSMYNGYTLSLAKIARYNIYEQHGIFKDSGGNNYTTGDCSPDNCSCTVRSGYFNIYDNRPDIQFPETEFCKGSSATIPIRLLDRDGIDDIGEVQITLHAGAVSGTVWVYNATAQRYNDWLFDRPTSFVYNLKGGSLMNYFNASVSGPNTTNDTGRIALTLTETGTTFQLEDIDSMDVYVNDSQFTGVYDPDNIERTRSTTISWIDPPTSTVAFSPDTIEHPGSSTLTWNLAGASDCRLSISSSPNGACAAVNNVVVPCSGTRTVTSQTITAESATCTAVVSGSNSCGNTSATATLRVIYASPWLMTTFGDTYAYAGYDGMKTWRATSFAAQVPTWAKNAAGIPYFSFYLVSKGTGTVSGTTNTWPNPSSLRSYQLGAYNDENRSLVGGGSLYNFFDSLITNNGTACTGVTITRANNITIPCSGRHIFLINNSSPIDLPASWNAAPNANNACVVIARGNVRVPANFGNVDAFLFSDGTIITNSSAPDQTLRINGGVVAGSLNFQRDLAQDGENPAELITYDPKYFALLRDCLGEDYPFRIREYNYSKATP